MWGLHTGWRSGGQHQTQKGKKVAYSMHFILMPQNVRIDVVHFKSSRDGLRVADGISRNCL
jgi:hypothetical protein